MKCNRGFSLIELMIAVTIIGIIAAIGIPNILFYQAKSRQSEAKAFLSSIFTAEKAWNAEWALYTGDFGLIGYEPEGDMKYHVGFIGVGPVAPVNYNGPAASGITTTSVFCDGTLCTNYSTNDVTNFSTPTATTFTGAANGDIDGDPTIDNWTINEAKQLRITGNNDLED